MNKRFLIVLLAALALLMGCERRPLEDLNYVNINLKLNIRLNVKVNGEVKALPEPEMMRVMFFDPKSYDLITESYLPPKGGIVSLPPGDYKFIAYNFDTEATLLRNDRNYYSIEAYTNDVPEGQKSSMLKSILSSKSATKADEDSDAAWKQALEEAIRSQVIYEPDHLFVSHQDVTVLNIAEDQTIEADAETIIETWKISVRIKNEQYMASAKALLTGQIASNFIGYPKEEGKTDTDVTLMFDMQAGTDAEENDIVVGTFNTFGKNMHKDSRLWLTILIKTQGGEYIEWHRDITHEFKTEEAMEDQIIYIEDELIIPEPNPDNQSSGNGGFQPGVTEWDEENIPINI